MQTITKSLLLIVAFIFTQLAYGQVTVLNRSSTTVASGTASSTITLSYAPPAGSNRLLMVAVSGAQGETATGVTYGGNALTPVPSGLVTNGNRANVRFYYLLNANFPGSTANLTATLTSSTNRGIVMGVVTFSGVDQINPLNTFISSTGSGSNLSRNSIASASNEIIFSAYSTRDSDPNTGFGAGQLNTYSHITGNSGQGDRISAGGSTKGGSTSATVSYTVNNSRDWALGAVSVKPVANPAPVLTITSPSATPSPLYVAVGSTVNFAWSATDADGVVSADWRPTAATAYAPASGSPGAGPFMASHTYNTVGSYVATLRATDGNANPSTGSGTRLIEVYDPNVPFTFNRLVNSGSDDAEQQSSNGNVSLASTDLELPFDDDGTGNQTNGLRFTNVTVPKGMTISNAYIQFTADASHSDPITLTIKGQAIDDAPTFVATNFDITSRTTTSATVTWSPGTWTNDDRTASERTVDISPILQEIIDRPGWVSGNDIVIIISGTGDINSRRIADSYDNGSASNAAELIFEYLPLVPVDLAIFKTVTNSTPLTGDVITFELTAVNNSSTEDATSVIVNDLLPSGYTFANLGNSPVGTYNSATGVWNIGTLAANSSATLKINCIVNCDGSYINTATISDVTTKDPSPNNNLAVAGTVPSYGSVACLVAVDDFSTALSSAGGIAIADVLANDHLNGSQLAPAAVTLSVISSSPGLTLITSGTNKGELNVAANTQPGDLTVVYEICEIANPTNCHQATARVFISDLVDGYINQPVPLCQSAPDPTTTFGISKKYQTPGTDLIALYSSPLMADIDGDGTTEIISLSDENLDHTFGTSGQRSATNILVFNGEDGTVQTTINTPYLSTDGPSAFAVADVDGDGFAEFIVASLYARNAAADQRYLYCYEHTGALKWKSNAQYGVNAGANGSGSSVGIADFNEDGIPEVYVYNEIFNAQSGVKLAQGGANGIGSPYAYGGVIQAISVAGDLTSSPGLELAAGRTVYNVVITNTTGTSGNSMTPINFTGVNSGTDIDGYTALADIDLDGELDVLVSARVGADDTRVYAWNPRLASGNRSMGSIAVGGSGVGEQHGAFFVGDVDGDGDPDMGLCVRYAVKMLSYDPNTKTFSVKWVLTTTDDSGRTGITMFDFNQDGKQEMVYRDEDELRIFDGSGAAPIVLATIPVNSSTGMESPIVGDVDGDGAAEIVVNDQEGSGFGDIEVYESSLAPWAPARNVWNQYAYFNTHINDNLSIPQYQSNHGQQLYFNNQFCPTQFAERPLNTFNVQSTYFTVDGCPSFPVFDAALVIESATLPCPSTTLSLTYTITNFADLVAIPAGMKITFYAGSPLTPGATVLQTETLANAILAGQSSGVLSVNITGISPNTKIFAVANDDGTQASPIEMPTTSYAECDYANNIAVITTRCENVNPDVNATHVNVPVPGDVSTNDNVPAGTTYGTSPSLTSSPSGSAPTITMLADGTYEFTGNLPGVYEYSVEVCVPPLVTPNCESTELSIVVTDQTINTNAPTANTDIATTLEEIPVVLNTLANDKAGSTSATLNPASVTIVSGTPNPATEGSLTINSTTGEITFTPVAGFVGTLSYEYQVCETVLTANCATATQEITVLGATSSAVSAADDYNRTQQGNAVTATAAEGLLANDHTTDNLATLEVSVASAGSRTVPGKGTFLIALDGSYSFTPAPGFTGPVSLDYEVCDGNACASATLYIVVDPFETNPDFNATFVNQAVTGDVNTNDNLVAGTTYGTPVADGGNPNGVVPTMNPDGTYSFTPTLIGVYVFEVPVCLDGQAPESTCKTETLTITVEDQGLTTNVPPVANTDMATTKKGQTVVLNTLANDAVGTPGTLLDPASVSIKAGTEPNAGTQGSLTVNPATGEIEFVPTSGFTGVVSYTYIVCDNQSPALCTEAVQEITVLPTEAQNSISASDDYIETEKGISVSGNVLSNDVDPEGNTLSVTAGTVSNPAGSVTFGIDGSYTFTPAAGYTGPGEFVYTVCDNGSPQACTEATLHVLVKPETFSIGGTVWYDPNGLTDNTFNGTSQGSADLGNTGTAPLFINYIDDNGNVVATTPVETNGSWSLDVASIPGATIQLSTVQGVEGQPKPATSLPIGWGNVGEGIGTSTSGDGTPDGEFVVTLTADQLDINFGFEIAPVTTPTITAAGKPNPGGTSLETVDAALFTGTDADGTVEVIKITAFPSNTTSFTVGTNRYYPNAAAIPGVCPTPYSCVDFSSVGSVEFPAVGNAGGNPVPVVAIDPFDNVLGSIIPVFTYKVVDNAGLEDDGTGVVNLVFSGERTLTVVGTAVCVNDVPFMDYTITANFDMTGLVGDILWTKGTNQSIPDPNVLAGTNATFAASTPVLSGTVYNGRTLWPGADTTLGAVASNWPAWVLTGAGWVNQEDGFSGYRSNDTKFQITVNPTAEISGAVDYPPSTPFCASEPRASIAGTVWQDVDGSGDAAWANIFTAGEAGTDATGLYAYVVGINPETGLQTVLDKATVNANGTFSFDDCIQGDDFSIVLSTDNSFNQGDDGTNQGTGIPTELLPSGWVATSPATRTPINSLLGNVVSADLGIQQIPTSGAVDLAGTVINNVVQGTRYNPGVIGAFEIPVAAFGGSDPDGEVTNLLITDFSAQTLSISVGTTTYYKGSVPAGPCPTASCQLLPAAGLLVPTNALGIPTQPISVTPIESFLDGNGVTIDYKVIDNAEVANGPDSGAESDNTTTLSIPFVALKFTSGGGWENGSDGSGKPNVNDGDKTLFWIDPPNVNADILDIPATVKNIIIYSGTEAVVSSCLKVTDNIKNDGTIRFLAVDDGSGANSPEYGQYLGPKMPNAIFEMALSEDGWHNIAFPVSAENGNPLTGADFAAANNDLVNPDFVHLTMDEGTHNLWWYDTEYASGKEQGFFMNRSNNSIAGGLGGSGYSSHAYGTWRMVSSTDELNAHGMNFFVDDNNVSSFPAIVNLQGTTNAEAAIISTHDNWGGWNLVPNVFPVTLDVQKMNGNGAADFFGSEFDHAIWIWNPGDAFTSPIPGQFSKGAYVAVDASNGNVVAYPGNGTGNVLTTARLIAPFQSFYIRRVTGSQTRRKDFIPNADLDPYSPNPAVDPNNSSANNVDADRITANGTTGPINVTLSPDYRSSCEITPHYKKGDDFMMLYAVDVDNPSLGDATELVFDYDYTNGYDLGYDIEKNGAQEGAPVLFSSIENRALIINKMQYPVDVTTVPLGFYSTKDNKPFRIEMVAVPSPSWRVYLEDKATGAWHELSSSAYEFMNKTSFRMERFVLHFSMNSTPIQPVAPATLAWGTSEGIEVSFSNMSSLQANVQVTNLLGQVLHRNDKVSTKENYVIPVTDPDIQVYMVTITTPEVIETFKVVR